MFALLSVLMRNDMLSTFDHGIILALRSAPDDPLGPPWFEAALVDVTSLGSFTVIGLVCTALLLVLITERHGEAALFLIGSLASGTLVAQAAKWIFERPRPDVVEHLSQTFTSSFPSAHATVGMLSYLVMAAVAVRFIPRAKLRRLVIGCAIAAGVLIGSSRVYLGVHWPSDVVAGWALGAAWASLCWLAAHYLSSRRRGQSPDLGKSET
ncbi:phosphatase PAP2 family protein [Tepidamorphus sp. 3E244]|uniref:phosphatase PAP2 family protein n=1 Tax=Tepidamorphus sp. 3E244 TaxID=3385498 RepID=UPI0038FCBDD8